MEQFEQFIRDQEAQGRVFDRREIITEFYLWHRPDISEDQLAAEVDAAMNDAAALRRRKMD